MRWLVVCIMWDDLSMLIRIMQCGKELAYQEKDAALSEGERGLAFVSWGIELLKDIHR